MVEKTGNWIEAKEAGAVWQLRFMRFIALNAPAILSSPILWVTALIFAIDKRRASSRASADYLHRVFGRVPTLMERQRHALTFSHVFFERVRLLAGGAGAFSIEMSGQDLVHERVAMGRGAVLLGAHYGSFEALRALDRELPGLSVRYVMYPENAQKSTQLLATLNPEISGKIISLANGPMAMIQVYEALENGEFVAFLGDRMPDSSTRAKVSVAFLGGKINVPTSPYLAAMAARVPIILSFAVWERRDRYRAEFSLLYDGENVHRKERAQVAQGLAQRYASVVESLCRRDPYNWFNFFDIWRG